MTDVLLVSLGATAGLRAADDELVASLRRAGAATEMVRAEPQRDVPTLVLTDLIWARAARAAAIDGIRRHRPRAVLYSTSTAALLWPLAGAIRFDALAAANRPGRHGIWQRTREFRRLAQATALVPWSMGSLEGAAVNATPTIVLPVPVGPSGERAAQRDVSAITYAANPHKKGLDRVLAAWRTVRREGEDLIVAGLDGDGETGIRYAGRLAPADYRALLRRARVYVTAPRREDYGIAQLEALADGCRVVTTPAPGPYAALPLLRALDLRFVSDDLAPALRTALDDRSSSWERRALDAIEPFRRISADAVVARELLPALLG